MMILVIDLVIAILLVVSLMLIGIFFVIIADTIRGDKDGFSWKWNVGSSILLILSIVGVIYLWNLDNSIRKDLPKKWIAVEVEKLPDKEKGFSSKDLMINHREQNPYVVYENVKYPKLIKEELVYINSVPTLNGFLKQRLKIVLPKNYDTDKRS
ncbi:TPA: glutamyl-tRNA amidotransferase [Listeria monocytogenes]|nr:glutamyl-tRNA amidotransferase [Listeria monocytogenes]EDH0792843.1 glutamyl-tRNA amidotransferase [Listeria monocytogenes]MCP8032831.1 glutamyl-tRNA amidotransferase [Listeria monocytogenes]HAA8360501.1 glutamyl-tRNA amidotransferase [Listeria monocytogenes]HAA8363659.1 glutamyl-tRNA amidotransferase [Listeria monocytogenes]